MNISSLGDSTGMRYYGIDRNEYANNISLCRDSGFIITGSAENNCLAGSEEIFLFKVDQNEDSSWFKTFSGLNHNAGNKVLQTSEGGFLVFGYSDSLYRIIKTDSLGNINSLNPYFITTSQNCAVFCNGDTALLTLNLPASTYLWSTGETSSSIQVTQSGYYNAQVIDSNNQVYNVPFLNVSFLNSNSSNLGPDTILCIDNTIVLDMGPGFSSYLWQDSSTQSSYYLFSSVPDTFLIYCNALANGNCRISDSVKVIYDICSNIIPNQFEEEYIQVYPNPFEDEITVHPLYPINGKLIIQDELGKPFFEENFTKNKTFNLSFLPAGIYFITVETNKKVFIEKFIKMK